MNQTKKALAHFHNHKIKLKKTTGDFEYVKHAHGRKKSNRLDISMYILLNNLGVPKIVLERPKFRRTRTDEERAEDKRKVIPVSLNDVELEMLKKCQNILEQRKESTCLKQVFEVGAECITLGVTGKALKTISDNRKRNKRSGVVDFED